MIQKHNKFKNKKNNLIWNQVLRYFVKLLEQPISYAVEGQVAFHLQNIDFSWLRSQGKGLGLRGLFFRQTLKGI